MDKSGDRVHLMFLEFLQNLHDPPQYSWGSGCLAWWVRVPSPKSRPSATALIHYREQLVRMQPGQIMWQPYEVDFGHLPDFCVAGRDMWTAKETELAATATPSTSATLLIPPTRGRRATASPSTSAARGRGRPATTRGVVTSPEIPAPIWHATPQPEVHPPIPDASPQFEVPSPTPPSQPSFDLGISFHLTPPMHPETPSYPPTSSSVPTLPIDPPRTEPMTMIPTPGLYTEHHYPPTSSSSDPLGPPIRIDTVHPDTDVPDEHPPHQPSPPRGRPQRARRAPTCGTGEHKIGHKGTSMHDDQPKDDASQPPPPPKHYTRVKKRKIVGMVYIEEEGKAALIEGRELPVY
ncbi:hypothetical protein SO802_029604 [Lithocarpus litseifolius]|uniref:Aminotransferase-like plant mobile domain-containing protein n=1 Tax=Lithocarpus litseifolius TaxID=425828 RepID=A0AAW2BWU7_9ROSI